MQKRMKKKKDKRNFSLGLNHMPNIKNTYAFSDVVMTFNWFILFLRKENNEDILGKPPCPTSP